MKKTICIFAFSILFCPLALFGQESKITNKFLYGAGGDLGFFHPSAFYDYVERYAAANNLESTSSIDGLNFAPRAFVGYRLNPRIDLMLVGEYAISQKTTYLKTNVGLGDKFGFNKLSGGLLLTYNIVPLTPKMGIIVSGGILYNHITMEGNKESLRSNSSIGFRLQSGVGFYSTDKFSLQSLIGYDYARANDRGFDLNYSGVKIGINIIFL
ncbi:hypothetical protein AGMMS4957_03300 [Bacteroidia bacterium]|nr:hypothetical protein AGMMS4957_03300 [Bacteroidia bacterium]